jgi:hypothetical protein
MIKRRRLVVRSVLAVILGCSWANDCAALARTLKFEQAFSDRGEPAAIHYEAVYQIGSAQHRIQVWRNGNRQLKRRTDDAVETYLNRTDGGPDYRMSVLNLKRRIHTTIDRTNLFRIGNYTEWFDIAHGLRTPRGEYQLIEIDAPPGAPAALEPCGWFELSQNAQVSQICWSAQSRLPMLIVGKDAQLLWRITQVSREPISAQVFRINAPGFVHHDANQDIDRD